MLKKAISQTLDPLNRPIKIYVSCTITSAVLWNAMVILKLLKQDGMTCTDLVTGISISCDFSDRISYAAGSLAETIGGIYAVIKKIAIDVYVIHIVVILTSHYKYLRNDLADILGDGESRQESSQEEDADETELKRRLKTWMKHYEAVLEICRILTAVTSLYVLVVYIVSTMRFCLLAYMLIKVRLDLFEKMSVCGYAIGNLIQLYMLCYCVQELFYASTSVTTKAFHAEWFTRSQSIKKIFSTIMIAEKIGIRLSAFGIVDLSLQTFMQIINLSYSVCLFLQNC